MQSQLSLWQNHYQSTCRVCSTTHPYMHPATNTCPATVPPMPLCRYMAASSSTARGKLIGLLCDLGALADPAVALAISRKRYSALTTIVVTDAGAMMSVKTSNVQGATPHCHRALTRARTRTLMTLTRSAGLLKWHTGHQVIKSPWRSLLLPCTRRYIREHQL